MHITASPHSALTILKEPPNLRQSVRWKLVDVLEMSVLGVVGTHGDDLVVLLTLHSEQISRC